LVERRKSSRYDDEVEAEKGKGSIGIRGRGRV
jgi:hypothetical protein